MRLFTLFFVLAVVSACVPSKSVKESSDALPNTIIQPAHPANMNILSVDFMVFGEKNKGDAAHMLNTTPLVCMDVKNYSNLSANMAEILCYIGQLQKIILYYEDAVSNNSK